jgi:hypothetical protein
VNKRPSFQFYPGDWVRDNVAGCSLSAQGLWLRMMVVMHDSERYGYLSINGKAISDELLARKCGTTLAEYRVLMAELDAAGVPSRTPQEGLIYSRRMVRDERERAQGRDYTRRSRAKEGKDDVRRLSDPSSSSSSPSSSGIKKPRAGAFVPPTLTEVKTFMKNDTWAQDFHDYFQSNGWKVGGRAPMKDWQAAARKWKRTEESRPPRSGFKTAAIQDGKKACWICNAIVTEREYRAHVEVCQKKRGSAKFQSPPGSLVKSFDELVTGAAAKSSPVAGQYNEKTGGNS